MISLQALIIFCFTFSLYPFHSLFFFFITNHQRRQVDVAFTMTSLWSNRWRLHASSLCRDNVYRCAATTQWQIRWWWSIVTAVIAQWQIKRRRSACYNDVAIYWVCFWVVYFWSAPLSMFCMVCWWWLLVCRWWWSYRWWRESNRIGDGGATRLATICTGRHRRRNSCAMPYNDQYILAKLVIDCRT